ncbi:MAG: carboxypeptidase-like regulatory domain-containing protein, partial [Candidatus Acidoferrales bacterium]
MKSAWAKVVVFLFVVMVLAITPAKAQITSGTVSGTVVDETGAVIPGATIRLINEETGVTREQESGGSGSFVFNRVAPGIYTVTVSMQGFRTFEVTGLGVRIGKVTSLRSISMEVGPSVEVVTITDTAAPLMQAESAQITASYTSEIVSETMLGVFGIDALAFLAPGVQPGFGNINTNTGSGSSGFGPQTGGNGAIGANGMRARFTNFTIDGQDNNDVTVSGPGFFVDMFDTVEEFQVTTNQFNADQGRNLGASINIITKSGTNQHHGSIYWFHENAELFNAVDSDPGIAGEIKPDKFIENFFGFTWGGPIVSDKLFGFGAWQRIKDDFSQTDDPGPFLDPAVIPAAGIDGAAQVAALGTNTATLIAGLGMNIPFGNPTCQVGRLFGANDDLGADGAVPQGPGIFTDPTGTFAFFDHFVFSGGFQVASALSVPWCSVLRTPGGAFLEDQFMMKMDWVGEKNTAGGKYMWQDNTVGPFDLLFNGTGAVNVPARSQFVNMYHTIQLSPRMLNEFRFSYQRLGVAFEGDPNSSFAPTPTSFPRSRIFENIGFIIPIGPWNFYGQLSVIPQDRI